MNEKTLKNVCLEIVITNGRPFKLMDDSRLGRILNSMLEGMRAKFTVNVEKFREKIGKRQMMSAIA